MVLLTKNAIKDIVYKNRCDDFHPNLQVIKIFEKKKKNGGVTIRVSLSDGEYYFTFNTGMDTQKEIESGRIKEKSVISLYDFFLNGNKKIWFILSCKAVSHPTSIIGKILPLPMSNTQTSSSSSSSSLSSSQTQSQFKPKQEKVSPFLNKPFMGEQTQKQSYTTSSSEYDNINVINNNMESEIITPISQLNPYVKTWTMRVRITFKKPIKTFNSRNGKSGSFFSAHLIDENSDEIKITFWNETCTKYEPIIQVGRCYLISKGQIKYANQKFKSSIDNEFEINASNFSQVIGISNDPKIPMENLKNIKRLPNLNNMKDNEICDILAIIDDIGDVKDITTKTNKNTQKRDLTLVDYDFTNNTRYNVKITLWGEKTQLIDEENISTGDVCVFKNVKKSSYNEVSLSGTWDTKIVQNVENCVKNAKELKKWWDDRENPNNSKNKNQDIVVSLTQQNSSLKKPKRRQTFSDIEENDLGNGQKPDSIYVKATIMNIRDTNMWYEACESPNCSKKVTIDEANGFYFCSKCGTRSKECQLRYLLNLTVRDHTGFRYVTAFNKIGQSLFDNLADDFSKKSDKEKEKIIESKLFTEHIMSIRVKKEQVPGKDHLSTKCTLMNFYPIKYKSEGKRMLNDIIEYEKLFE